MGRPKGNVETETIGTRLPVNMVGELQKYADNRGVTRSSIVAKAIDEYIHSKECINCGALNNRNMETCYHCGSKLFSDDHIKTAIGLAIVQLIDENSVWEDESNLLGEVREYIKGNNSYFDKFISLGLKPEAEYIIDRRNEETRYLVHFHFVADGVDLVPKDDTAIAISKDVVYSVCESYAKAKKEIDNKKSE